MPSIQKISLLSLGCPKNQVDSEALLGYLNGDQFQQVQDPNLADVLIINTCSFIQDAIRESISEILHGASWKEQQPGRKLFVMGCLPARYPEDLAPELPEVDGFFNIGDVNGILHALNAAPASSDDDYFAKRRLLSPSHYAYLRIADGCSQGCRYCTISKIRGPYRSRTPDDILKEARKLAASGVVELILIGQEITSYGTDINPRSDLLSLLNDISQIESLHWIRLMYNHPPVMTDQMITGLSGIEKLCKYLDFPIEHASDHVLKAMGRKTTVKRITEQINLLRQTMLDITLRTSIIVGHPGEDEAEYSQLLDFLDEIRFDHLGVFAYSPEEGTPAIELPGFVSPDVALDRRDQLMMLAQEWAEERNQRKINQSMEILIDETDHDKSVSIGRTEGDAPEIDGTVIIKQSIEPGIIVPVTITGYQGFDLQAETINQRELSEYTH